MSTATTFKLCHECTAAIVNDDYSGMDEDTDYPRVSAFAESVGYLVEAGEFDGAGYWDCQACDQTQIGHGHLMETLT
ncbi:hypothetical protein KIV65_gp07 [Mycobacterium phage Anthony]|uniref:Uncharacterized protein n=1 Tax=Mycobacterium phage Anthony TaxID=2599857 RepID=A0A5J6TI58_9CAUD|nr:hypothetical protein KIV65_gp07 [Mycobacterium phage Anthony]QFG10460.1 hypothetical protein PBI_ANTHONY_90 [Mycobacterium phage Anthony]